MQYFSLSLSQKLASLGIICRLKGHKRGETWYEPWNKTWHIECEKCGAKYEYYSRSVRSVGNEILHGFTGK